MTYVKLVTEGTETDLRSDEDAVNTSPSCVPLFDWSPLMTSSCCVFFFFFFFFFC